ncbi:hypothetical protein [Uliginosibacterium aquaticum]|uniref:Uncharacterized protein n=1 Tax=Uliginosibacterium aquaticum TaxID=2731212 RepID=A0ABX2IHW4_9RHOO|nr:hypothetical protein [Uliginosibacterium aquaticum]NSL56354.1 hypothetical protein [Uliginosibacterium aquaticum]
METNQDTPAKKRCCGTDKAHRGSKLCCAGKLLGTVIVLALVAGVAFCAGTRFSQAGSAASAKLAAQEIDKIPVLRP